MRLIGTEGANMGYPEGQPWQLLVITAFIILMLLTPVILTWLGYQ
jgi:hypothetical protein